MTTLLPPGTLPEATRRLLNSILANCGLLNTANTWAAQQNFGGATASYPSLSHNGAVLEAKLADGSAYAGVSVGGLTSMSTVRTLAVTVAELPSAATSAAGARAFVTDATATTFASVVAGGGTNKVPVYSDGAAWRVG